MAYHSFGGEVEALNTPTIRRLTPSCRHQLSRIALLTVTRVDRLARSIGDLQDIVRELNSNKWLGPEGIVLNCSEQSSKRNLFQSRFAL
jgi:hypothetical protein